MPTGRATPGRTLPCRSASSPVSRGRRRQTSSSSRSSATPTSPARSASSTGGRAASSRRSPRSASCAASVQHLARRGRRAAGQAGRVRVRRARPPSSTARSRARSAPRGSGGSSAVTRTRSRSGSTRSRRVEGGVAAAAELVARGVVEGGFEPKAIYRDDTRGGAARARRADARRVRAATRRRWPKAAERGRIIGEGANIARRLVEPRRERRHARRSSPTRRARSPRTHGLWIDVIDETRAAELGHGHVPRRRAGERQPAADDRDALRRRGRARTRSGRHLALVGKGVCFDSGGISIKPADRMEEMKMDKTGACTVIAAIATVARLAPGHAAARGRARRSRTCPAPHSTRPGDIVKALNGKWVDITNTDAEGRLILGDAMTYAEQLGRDPPRRRRDAHRRRRPGARQPRDRRVRDPGPVLGRRGVRGRRGPASATGGSRSSGRLRPRWRAGTATSRTPARPRGRS